MAKVDKSHKGVLEMSLYLCSGQSVCNLLSRIFLVSAFICGCGYCLCVGVVIVYVNDH